MNWTRNLSTAIAQLRRTHFDPASLQFRLTLEVAVFAILGLSSVAVWSSWKMQQMLIVTHQQQVEYVAARFPRDVELYSKMLPLEVGLQRTIDNVTTPGLLIWVQSSTGKVLARSPELKSADAQMSAGTLSQLESLAAMPLQAQVYQVNQRYFALSKSPVTLKGAQMATVYLAQDITEEQNQLNGALQGLTLVCILATSLMMIAIAVRIRRSLQPLQEINQLADAISADDLGKAQLQLQHAPSEVKELTQTFNMMLSRLSESWEQQRQFVSNASHELRTPLTVVVGYLNSVLRRSANLSEYQREALETASSEADRTVSLLQDLLDLARADSGYLAIQLEPICLNDLVQEVAGMTQKFGDRILTIEAQEPAMALADRDRLRQVLINLIDNAVKYSEPDQPITLKLENQPSYAAIHVCDRGIGIPLADQSRIFERFYRVDEARSRLTGGHGLGLAIVKTLVEKMNGTITVRSKPQQGTTFTILLPAP